MHVPLWQLWLFFGSALLLLLLLVAGFQYERVCERNDLRRIPPPGRMVTVGKHRLHLLVTGEAGPAVVIEQGAGGLSRFWWNLQDKIAPFAQVCTYDRAGYGWSEPTPESRTIPSRAEELRTLLRNAGVPAPYILVAHSYGGLIVRSYAETNPSEVAGLVLVDTPEESSIFNPAVLSFYAKMRLANRVIEAAASFGFLRLLRRWIPLDRYGIWLTHTSEFRALCDDLDSLAQAPEAQRSSRYPGSLATLPVIVITHGQPFPGPFAVLETNWSEGQRRLAALSLNSRLVVSAKSNHLIQEDDPDLILRSICTIIEAHRAGIPLADTGT